MYKDSPSDYKSTIICSFTLAVDMLVSTIVCDINRIISVWESTYIKPILNISWALTILSINFDY